MNDPGSLSFSMAMAARGDRSERPLCCEQQVTTTAPGLGHPASLSACSLKWPQQKEAPRPSWGFLARGSACHGHTVSSTNSWFQALSNSKSPGPRSASGTWEKGTSCLRSLEIPQV